MEMSGNAAFPASKAMPPKKQSQLLIRRFFGELADLRCHPNSSRMKKAASSIRWKAPPAKSRHLLLGSVDLR
ncbi:hypothetical protein VE23_15100 [Paenibacillus sp. D9]|nr:hypothetical protein VE23_15100 [Paenibacillus sp. D9]CDN44478.1 hypothetical protein BN871_EX_00140 [Paenibacillus sp. P22]